VQRFGEVWPEVKIIVPGDSGFCRWQMMRWCDRHGVDYILGLAKNAVLKRLARRSMIQSRWNYPRTEQKQRLFEDLTPPSGLPRTRWENRFGDVTLGHLETLDSRHCLILLPAACVTKTGEYFRICTDFRSLAASKVSARSRKSNVSRYPLFFALTNRSDVPFRRLLRGASRLRVCRRNLGSSSSRDRHNLPDNTILAVGGRGPSAPKRPIGMLPADVDKSNGKKGLSVNCVKYPG
jgi:hypothetical protein